MIKKNILFLMLSTFLILTACSSNSSDKSGESADTDMAKPIQGSNESAMMDSSNEVAFDQSKNDLESVEQKADTAPVVESSDRMIIHQAQLHVKVKSFQKTQLNIEKKVKEYGGYIVESNIYQENEERYSGNIIVRVPEKHFQNFLQDTEEEAADILERNVTGQDVTEQYVDLESRLKSKRAVEERLLDFMKDAKKTEDLLKISSDLAKIQEEIEVIVGKMKYLENQTSFSTIEINMYEDRVVVPNFDNKDLNTWEKTKKQLVTSTNLIITAVSGLVVFLIGNMPIFFILILVGLGVYFIFRRKSKGDKTTEGD